MVSDAVAAMSDAELMAAEREIARRHIGKFPALAVAWGLGNFIVWLSLWPLVFSGVLPLWSGFMIATLNLSLCYLPSHEAQHDIIARPGEKLRWLNELVGHVSTIPLVSPYRFLRLTHLEHHKHANDPALDPDYAFHAADPARAIIQTFRNRRPRGSDHKDAYAKTLVRIGRADVILDAIIYEFVFYGALFALAWSGTRSRRRCCGGCRAISDRPTSSSSSAGRRIIRAATEGVIATRAPSASRSATSPRWGCSTTSFIISIRASRSTGRRAPIGKCATS